MTELLIFTILATSVAVYSILPPFRKGRAKYVLRSKLWIAWLSLGLFLIISLYILDQYLILTETTLRDILVYLPEKVRVIEGESRFAVVFAQIFLSIALLFSLLVVFFTNLPNRGDENILVSLIRGYFQRGEFETLCDLIDDNYDLLLYEDDSRVPEAASLTKDFLLNPRFANEHPVLAPQLGIRIISDDRISVSYRKGFLQEFVETQLGTDHSLIYQEVPDNLVTSGFWQYKLIEEHEFLYPILSDIEMAEDLNAAYAVQSHLLNILQEHGRGDFDPYNESRLQMSRDANYSAYNDPVYVGVKFLDLLTVRAIEENRDNPIAVTAIMSIVRNMCDNYEKTSGFQPDQEWSNDYEYLLYEIFQQMIEWVRVVKSDHQNVGQYSIELDNISAEWTGSIAKSATYCLAICHRNLLITDDISDEFKDQITLMIARLLCDLRQYNQNQLPWMYNEQILHCMENECSSSGQGQSYKTELKRVLQRQGQEIKAKDYYATNTYNALNGLVT